MTLPEFRVSYKGQSILISQFDGTKTVAHLKEHIAIETDLPPECQKLLHKGKILQDHVQLLELGLTDKAKLMLMGTQPQQREQVAELDAKLRQRHTLAPVTAIKRRPPPPTKDDLTYTFHRITVLGEFPRQGEARKLLERLKNDRGVRAIMKERKWSVGELTELTPFETGILGYNRNAGQLIAIRLRTDDLSGFRHYDSVRKVLLHELTHNVWSEHDDNFHALLRQLNKDVVNLDWAAHGGHALASGGEFYEPDDEEVGQTWQGGSHRLGGQSAVDARDARLRAAMARLSKREEQEMDEGCSSHR